MYSTTIGNVQCFRKSLTKRFLSVDSPYEGVAMVKAKIKILTRTVTLTMRRCPMCKLTFEGWGKQTYCGKLCANKAAYERNADTYRAHRREKYHAEKIASKN
jgi:tRNA(Ile2) C34 agmatinyltransferase TiaS